MTPLNVYVLLDRSGSMAGRMPETMGSLNSYVTDLKSKNVAALLTVATFDGGAQFNFDIIRNKISLYDFTPLVASDAEPRGYTPLFDAIGRIYPMVEGEKATLIIMTDGEENQSREMTRDGAKSCIDRLKAKGYDVVYIGADFNAFGQASQVGLNQNVILNTAQGFYDQSMKIMATRSAMYASGAVASSLNFSDDDRARASGLQLTTKS